MQDAGYLKSLKLVGDLPGLFRLDDFGDYIFLLKNLIKSMKWKRSRAYVIILTKWMEPVLEQSRASCTVIKWTKLTRGNWD